MTGKVRQFTSFYRGEEIGEESVSKLVRQKGVEEDRRNGLE